MAKSLSQTTFPLLKQNVSTATLTTFGVGGPVSDYIVVKTSDELVVTIQAAQELAVPYLVMAGGSNLVFPDRKLEKLLIHIQSDARSKTAIKFVADKTVTLVVVEAGVSLGKLITTTLKHNLVGLEALSGIPGTVGGAVVGNAGAYGQTISDHLESITIFDGKQVRVISKKAGQFSYRNSIFKHKPWLVLSVTFKLTAGDGKALRAKSKSIILARNQKYPPGLKCPGSFFKNVLVKNVSKVTLAKVDQTKIIDGKIPTGWLLEQVGARGSIEGGIYIPEYHGNLLVNDATGTYADVLKLARTLKAKVKRRFGIELEEEVRYML
jgi:UDP-N-acetylmuramate dehydrogenase